jgi:hypothetical protein
MILIEYYNTYDILGIHYEGSYKNKLWLDVVVKKPNYVIEREATENSLGESVTTFLKWSKQYSFDIYCLEPLADALTTITMHDNVWITFENGYQAQAKEFLADVEWTDIENVAKITVTFITQSHTVSGQLAAGCIAD